MTSDQPQYAYDGEGRLCAFQDASGQVYQYLYDADGNRVAKGKSSSTVVTCDLSTFTLTNEYIVDQSGQQITEVDGSGNWVHTNAYANGELIATFTPPAGAPPSPSTDAYALHYQLSDWEGTRRMQVSPAGTVEEGWQNLPYGDQLYPVPDTADATEQHFTGKERDAESGNDYFGARYYGSSMGRFISPDWSGSPSPVPFADYGEPQSLNLYAYVGNNPLSSIDPDGHGPPCLDAHGEPCPPAPPRPGDPYSVDFDDLLLEGFSFTPIPLNEQSLHQMPIPRGNGANTKSQAACIAEALMANVPGIQSLTPTPNASPFFKGGHENDTFNLSFSSPAAADQFLSETSRTALVPSTVSEYGFGPGERLSGGLHAEFYSYSNNLLAVTAHLDRFNPNDGVGPLLGHIAVDLIRGHLPHVHLDKGCGK